MTGLKTMHMRNLAFLVVSMLASCASAVDSFGFATWNVGHFALGLGGRSTIDVKDVPAKASAYRKFLSDAAVSVVGVCEHSAAFSSDGSAKAADTAFADFAACAAGPTQGAHANAVYWKDVAKFVSSGHRDYPVRNAKCYYEWVRLEIAGREVCFVETHCDWDTLAAGHESDRIEQMKHLVREFGSEPRVVIAGDFNTCRRKSANDPWLDAPDEFEVFRQAGFKAAHWGSCKTWPASAPYMSIDNVFVKGFAVSDVRVLSDKTLSDHCLLRCTLTFDEARSETAARLGSAISGPSSVPEDAADGYFINKDNYELFCNSNETLLKEKPHGVVVEFPGLDGGSCLGGKQDLGAYTNSWSGYPEATAAAGLVHVYLMPGPWSWMNPGAVRTADLVVDAVRAKFCLPEDSPLIASGGSMGGLGALVFAAKSRHRVTACAAACPCFDVLVLYHCKADFARTYVSAIAALTDRPLVEGLKCISPQHLLVDMPDIPYLIVCDCADRLFPAGGMDDYVGRLRRRVSSVEYVRLAGKEHGEFTPECRARFHEFVCAAGRL